jgi:hypothetical protein
MLKQNGEYENDQKHYSSIAVCYQVTMNIAMGHLDP